MFDKAKVVLVLALLAALRGLTIHTAFVTMGPLPPANVKSVSNTYSFLID